MTVVAAFHGSLHLELLGLCGLLHLKKGNTVFNFSHTCFIQVCSDCSKSKLVFEFMYDYVESRLSL